jgi:thiosulfate/3-mercaptopyruvate sulfurtransferase
MDNQELIPIIESQALKEIFDRQDLIIIDAGSDEDAYMAYQEEHIEGAIYIDSNELLCSKGDPIFGGRHPLPEISFFLETMAKLGISEKSYVVVYDNKYLCNAAARLWWMLKAIGIKKVQVLNGGFQCAKSNGIKTTATVTPPKQPKSIISISDWKLPYVTLEKFKILQSNINNTIIDVRSERRYQGIEEPIDLIAGHIQGAINIPFNDHLNNDGTFLAKKDLLKKYKIYSSNDFTTLVYCGSGVTACHTILAFAIAGLSYPTLYVGSWSEWSRNNLPIRSIS